jgi:hypothetical protein
VSRVAERATHDAPSEPGLEIGVLPIHSQRGFMADVLVDLDCHDRSPRLGRVHETEALSSDN